MWPSWVTADKGGSFFTVDLPRHQRTIRIYRDTVIARYLHLSYSQVFTCIDNSSKVKYFIVQKCLKSTVKLGIITLLNIQAYCIKKSPSVFTIFSFFLYNFGHLLTIIINICFCIIPLFLHPSKSCLTKSQTVTKVLKLKSKRR